MSPGRKNTMNSLKSGSFCCGSKMGTGVIPNIW